jgi:hypothetical protein
MDDAGAQVMHHQIILITTCGGQLVAPARAKIILDLWLMNGGPFVKAFVAAIF